MPDKRDPRVGDIYQDGVLSIEVVSVSKNEVQYLLTNRAARTPIQAMPMTCKNTLKQWAKRSMGWDFIHAAN